MRLREIRLATRQLGVPGTSLPNIQDGGCTPRGSLLPVDLHIVLGAGAHWYVGVHQIEEFEAHLHIPVVGHLDREMLWGCWLLRYLTQKMSTGRQWNKMEQGPERTPYTL